jgi:hypothetical protein
MRWLIWIVVLLIVLMLVAIYVLSPPPGRIGR